MNDWIWVNKRFLTSKPCFANLYRKGKRFLVTNPYFFLRSLSISFWNLEMLLGLLLILQLHIFTCVWSEMLKAINDFPNSVYCCVKTINIWPLNISLNLPLILKGIKKRKKDKSNSNSNSSWTLNFSNVLQDF